jgi:hypothetical protein
VIRSAMAVSVGSSQRLPLTYDEEPRAFIALVLFFDIVPRSGCSSWKRAAVARLL